MLWRIFITWLILTHIHNTEKMSVEDTLILLAFGVLSAILEYYDEKKN